MLKMGKDVFLPDNYLSSLGMRVSLELEVDVGTHNTVSIVLGVLDDKNLPVLEILQAVTSYQCHPVFVHCC